MTRLGDGDVFEYAEHSFRVRFKNDDSAEPPWAHDDMHGVVSGWVRRAKRPWEMILAHDHGAFRLYDFRASVQKARDVWGCPNPSKAARADFNRLREWCEDRWHYIGVIVVPLNFKGVPITGIESSLWGIESDSGDYLSEVAHDLARECMAALPREVMP